MDPYVSEGVVMADLFAITTIDLYQTFKVV
jgi:hypothetical protein